MQPRIPKLTASIIGAFLLAAMPAAHAKDNPSAPKTSLDANKDKDKPAANSAIEIGDATRIVLICDTSGTMISKAATAKDMLTRTVTGLKPKQSVAIVFMGEDRIEALPKATTLLPATPKNQKELQTLIDGMTPTGSAKMLPAIESAFARKPQLIVLILGDNADDQKAAIEKVKALDKDKKVKINVIALTSDGAEFDGKDAKQFAEATGGTFKVVKEVEFVPPR